jgi:plastocyanin
MNRFLLALFAVVIFTVPIATVFAQSSSATDRPVIVSDTISTGGYDEQSPLRCDDYYKFGSVKVTLLSDVVKTVPGALLTFSGDIHNENNLPLVDVAVIAKIFKRDDATLQAGNSNPVIDQFIVREDVTLKAQETKPLTLTWRVPNNAEQGEYYAAYYVVSNDSYSLSGLAFTDDVIGGQTTFSILNENKEGVVILLKNKTTFNGEPYLFASFPPYVERNDSVEITSVLSNPTKEKKSIPLQWNQYTWDSQKKEHIRNTKTELVNLEPGEDKTVQYTAIGRPDAVGVVTAVAQDGETKSLLTIRYARSGVEELRTAALGISTFPLQSNTPATVFSCAHGLSSAIQEDSALTLTLKDREGAVVHTYTYTGAIAGKVGGFGETFTPTKAYDYLTLESVLQKNGVVQEKNSLTYDCATLDQSACLSVPVTGTPFSFDSRYALAGGGVLVLLGLAYAYMKRRKSIIPHITTSCLFLLLMMGSTQAVEAETVSVVGSYTEPTFFVALSNSGEVNFSADYQVQYHASILNVDTNTYLHSGDSIPVGTKIKFETPARSTGSRTPDLFWNFTGSIFGTPQGYWSKTPSCGSGVLIGGGGDLMNRPFSVYAFLSVNYIPEIITPSGVTLQSLGGGVYEVMTAGTLGVNFTFPSTPAKWNLSTRYFDAMGRQVCGVNPTDYTTIPEQTINFSINVTGGGGPVGGPCTWDSVTLTDDYYYGPSMRFVRSCPTTGSTMCSSLGITSANDGQPAPPGNPESCLISCTINIPYVYTSTMEKVGPGCGTTNTPPGTPSTPSTITGTVNVPVTIPVSPTDPDNDDVRTGYDWNNDGSIDEWVPGSGYTGSGTRQDGVHTWTTPGTYPVQVVVEDDSGVRSTPKTVTVSIVTVPSGTCGGRTYTDTTCATTASSYQCTSGEKLMISGTPIQYCATSERYHVSQLSCNTDPTCTSVPVTPLPPVDVDINGSDGPVTVAPGTPITITWTSPGLNPCTLYGAGTVNGPVANTGNVVITASISDSYILSCGPNPGDADQVQVIVSSTAPSNPTIVNAPTSANPGDTVGIIVNSNDPNNDNVYFEGDWNNDGIPDGSPTPIVASGQNQTISHTWSVPPGTYPYQIRSVDSGGLPSGWTQGTITINNVPPTITVFETCVNSAPCTPGTSVTVNPGDTVVIKWNSSGASSCSSTDFVIGGPISHIGTGSLTIPTAGTSDTYTITCDNGSGSTTSSTVTVNTNGLPDLGTPSVSHSLGTFDPITGLYNTVTINFNTTNTGGMSTGGSFPYRSRLDKGDDGSFEDIQTGSVPTLAAGASSPVTAINFTNVPFGPAMVELTVDEPNTIAEGDETDNTYQYRFVGGMIPPPDPGLSITADRTQIRNNETVTLSWSRAINYPMNCRIYGPGVNIATPSVPGSQVTAPIVAKSEYTFSCTEPITNTTWTKSVTVETQGVIEET